MPGSSLTANLPGMSAALDTMVVTCAVPCAELDELELVVRDHTVAVTGPAGFRHELELPDEADMRALTVELYKGFLELRAPRR
jgi:HSP20 family molecular chaperone IbpA